MKKEYYGLIEYRAYSKATSHRKMFFKTGQRRLVRTHMDKERYIIRKKIENELKALKSLYGM